MPHRAARPQSSEEGAEPAQGLPRGAAGTQKCRRPRPDSQRSGDRACGRGATRATRAVRRRAGQATWYLPTSRKWRSASGVLSSRAALAAARRAGLMDESARMRTMATRSSSAWAMR